MVKKSPKKAQEAKSAHQHNDELSKKRSDLLEAIRGHRAGELQNPRVLREIRKDIARILTAKNAKKQSEKGEQ